MFKLTVIYNRNRAVLLMIVGLLMFSVLLMPRQISAQSSQDGNLAGKKVLLVSSYHEGHQWTDDIVLAASTILESADVEVQVIHMDTKRNADEEFRLDAVQQVLAEIDAFEPDLIIATEDNAQKYLVVPYLIDTELPVIFVGVNWDASVYGYPASNVTGMIEIELIDQLINQLSRHASGDRIGYLAVTSNTELKSLDIIQERFFDDDLEVYLVETYDEYTAAFLEAQDTVDILFLGSNAGIDRWDDDEAQQFIAENTSIPTGSTRERTAPYSLMTMAKIGAEQGEWAAETVLDILAGTSIEDIPVTENKRGNLILNLEIADQMGIIFSPSVLRIAEVYEVEEG